jgi:hypothetical protein
MARGGTDNNKQQAVLADEFSFSFSGNDNVEVAKPDIWTPAPGILHEAEMFENEYSVDVAVGVALLKNANGDFKRTYSFFQPTDRSLVPKPEQVMPGMMAAGREIYATAERGEKIAIFGDYDPDGTTGVETLRRAVAAYATDRDQIIVRHARGGRFGLTVDFVREASEAGATLLITVDCGSADIKQVRYAQSLGMKVIVVDHHLAEEDLADPSKNNPAEHHLNPQLTGTSELTGSPLAWHLGRALHHAAGGSVPDDYYAAPMFLAGFGLQADRGRLDTLEHRSLIWSPQLVHGDRAVPIGMVVLATLLAADPVINSEDIVKDPNNRVIIAAAMNASKRYSDASADEVGLMLAAPSRAKALPHAQRILDDYKKVKLARAAIQEEILIPGLQAQIDADQVAIDEYNERRTNAQSELTKRRTALTRAANKLDAAMADEGASPEADAIIQKLSDKVEAERERLSSAEEQWKAASTGRVERGRNLHSVLVEDERFIKFRGLSGLLAPAAVRETGKASLVGVAGAVDEANGEALVKFRLNVPPAIEGQARKEAEENKRKKTNAQSRQRMLPGHLAKNAELRALCTFAELDENGEQQMVASLGGHAPLLSGACTVSKWPEVEAWLSGWADEVAGKNGNNWHIARSEPRHKGYANVRLGRNEAKRLVMIEKQSRQYGPTDWDHGHRGFSISAIAKVENVHIDENGYQRARLVFDPNTSREVFISRHAAQELPGEGQEAEFILKMDGGSRYVISSWFA